jgi:hypothetical protein
MRSTWYDFFMVRSKPSKGSRGESAERSPEETERIREATLKRLLNTPPKQHKDMLAERKAKRPIKRGRDR